MTKKYLIKYCICVFTTLVMLNFVGYTLSAHFVQQEKVSSLEFSDDDAENGKESKEEVKNLFILIPFDLDFFCVELTGKEGIIPTNIELPIWHALPETPPPDLMKLKS